jgi:adenylate cyclase
MSPTSKKNIGIFLILALLMSALIQFNAFSHLRSTLTDQLQAPQPPLENILIIAIDDESIQSIGRWPWSRDVLANFLPRLREAKTVGIDISFLEPSENDLALATVLQQQDNIILAAEINNEKLYAPIFNTSYGYVNLITDNDGITRSLATSIHQEVQPFAFQIYQQTWTASAPQKEILKINFIGPPETIQTLSFKQAQENPPNVTNKIVLIGATAPDLHDTFFVPTSKGVAMSGVEIHATIIQNLILKNDLTHQQESSLLLLMILAAGAGFFILSRMKPHNLIPLILAIIIIYIILAIYLAKQNFILDLFFAPLSLLLFTGAGLSVNYLEERKHSAYLTDAFGRYISKDLLAEIVQRRHELKLGGAKRTITVFFSDIRGFTSISERLSPEDLVDLVNEYLTVMTKKIIDHKGTVDKFIGDAIMAFWNAPLLEKSHANLACKSAISQITSLKILQKRWKKKGLPEINIGCGIHTGDAIIGNLGSEERFDYTAMGDTVNLASRLEGLTKPYGVSIIISESTKKLIDKPFLCRKLDSVKVKGKTEPVNIYELCLTKTEKEKAFIKVYERALALYFKQDFKKALSLFKKANNLKPTDLATQTLITRCKQYQKSPPKKDWDGGFEMTSK